MKDAALHIAALGPQWKRLSARYDAMPRRERLMLPAALCFAVLMLGHLLLIEPALKQRRLWQQQLTQERTDLAFARAQIAALNTKLAHPNAELREQLDGLHRQTLAANERFRQLQGSLVPAQEVSQWLAGLLQSQRGLQLTGLRTLPATSVGDLVAGNKAPAAAPPAASAPGEAGPPRDTWLYRHGVEITLRGNYQYLLAYLQALERMPRRVYWGELQINAQDSPAVVMTLTVYTISLEKTWWVI